MFDNSREFDLLKKIEGELSESLRTNTLISPQKLKMMRDHIRLCDSLEKDRFVTVAFFAAVEWWKRCYARWLMYGPSGNEEMSDLYIKTKKSPGQETKLQTTALERIARPKVESHKTESPDPEPGKHPWDITKNDKRFLDSLKIADGDKPIELKKNPKDTPGENPDNDLDPV